MTVLEEIRLATRAAHDELEKNSRIVERLLRPDGRRELLCVLYWLYEASERRLLPWLGEIAGLNYEQRLKLPTLRADLTSLGVGEGEQRRLGSAFPALACRAEALGFAYVLEGATLGGRVIRKRLVAAGSGLDGTSFFDVYGTGAGPHWKQFCRVLERECSVEHAAAVRGACAGFDFMRDGLHQAGSSTQPLCPAPFGPLATFAMNPG